MFLLDGKRLQAGVAFTHDDIQYPANWLNLSTAEEKAAIGITEVAEQARPDDKFYWVTDNNDGTFTATPKLLEDREESDKDGNPLYVQEYDPTANNGQGGMVDTTERLVTKGLKSQLIAQVKASANSILSQSDWMVIRKAERNVDIPADTATLRTAVVAKTTQLEAAITAATTVEQLAAIDLSLPTK